MTEDHLKTTDEGTSFTINLDDIPHQDFSWSIDIGRPQYKFNEGQLIEEFKNYINSTYDGHYSKENFQATEFIIDGGHGEGFCIGNVLKYAQRYGKKGTRQDARKDLMKVLHYALIQLYVHDLTYSEDKEEETTSHNADDSNGD